MDKLLTPDFWLMFWTVVNFLALAFVLGKFAWKPLIKALEERENRIARDKADAETARQSAQKLQAELDAQLDGIAAQAAAKMKQVEALAQTQKQSIIEEGKKASATLIDQAKTAIEAEKLQALSEVKKEIASISLLAAQKVAGIKADAASDAQLVNNVLKDIADKKEFKA